MSAPELSELEVEAVARVLTSGQLSQGPEVEAFEEEFSSIVVDNFYCAAVNSGTSALHLALLALGIGPGDEVLVPSFTFAATANSVALTGATPVFVDIDPESYCVDPAKVEEKISSKTRAVIPVHLYGHPADMPSIMQIAQRHGLLVVEDCAQAHMAEIANRRVGTWGHASAFSFYPTKNMTTGEGGMVVTSIQEVDRKVRLLRNQGQRIRYENEVVGFNYRMSDIHAAIGRVQVRKLDDFTRNRQSNARFFDQNLTGVSVPRVRDSCSHVYHQYTVRVPNQQRDSLARHLAEKGIATGVYYPIPVHKLPSFAQLDELPETGSACREVLSLPIHPHLKSDDLEFITDSINAFTVGAS